MHIGDFNIIAGSKEYKDLIKTMEVLPATDRTDLVTIGSAINTTWNIFTRPLYQFACWYLNNYGWMDLVLINENLKSKVHSVAVVDLKNKQGKSVTDHETVAVVFDFNQKNNITKS